MLDLDETLIHSNKEKLLNNSSFLLIEVYNNDNKKENYYVYKRPYVDEFLDQLSKMYNLVIFTASNQQYAEEILNGFFRNNMFQKKYYREVSIFNSLVKDQKKVGQKISSYQIQI